MSCSRVTAAIPAASTIITLHVRTTIAVRVKTTVHVHRITIRTTISRVIQDLRAVEMEVRSMVETIADRVVQVVTVVAVHRAEEADN